MLVIRHIRQLMTCVGPARFARALLFHKWKRRAFRIVAIGSLAAFGVLALAALARQAQPYVPVGDIALLESYTIDAMRGQLLVGPYSRFGWHHPGPIYFYLLAIWYALADHRTVGLAAGALAINIASLLAFAWIAFGAGGRRFAAVTLGLTVIYLFRVREILASPWNPHVLVLPMMLLVVSSAALASGRLALLPLVALVATFIVQTHVGLVPAVVTVSGCSAAAGILFALRSTPPAEAARVYRTLNAAMWVLAVLWFLPLAEQFRSPHGNFGELWRFFTRSEPHGQAFAVAFTAWGETVSAIVSRHIQVGWGSVFRPRHDWFAQSLSVAELVLLAVVAIRAGRQGRRFPCAAAALLLLTSLVALWSATRIEGEFVDHAVFWISGTGALNLAVLLNELLHRVWRRPVPRSHPIAVVLCSALCIVGAALGVQRLYIAIARSVDPGPRELAALRLSEQIEGYLWDHPGITPVIKVDQFAWAEVAGVVVDFQRKGIPFAIERDRLWMFTDILAPTGHENAVLTIARRSVRDQLMTTPKSVTIGEHHGIYAVLDTSGPGR